MGGRSWGCRAVVVVVCGVWWLGAVREERVLGGGLLRCGLRWLLDSVGSAVQTVVGRGRGADVVFVFVRSNGTACAQN